VPNQETDDPGDRSAGASSGAEAEPEAVAHPPATEWQAHFVREETRYRDGEGRLPDAADLDARQRQLTRLGNAAWGAGLALMMAGRRDEANGWFARAADRYAESFPDAPPGSWGRPIGAMKAHILAGDWTAATSAACWALGAGGADATSPIGRYAAALAELVVGDDEAARGHADALRASEEFPTPVGDALAFIATRDVVGYTEAVEAVLRSFETRDEYLEDVPVADTVLVLKALAERRGLATSLASPLLPPPPD
jgi:hypothetical protein